LRDNQCTNSDFQLFLIVASGFSCWLLTLRDRF
jgi:hypothetical protein